MGSGGPSAQSGSSGGSSTGNTPDTGIGDPINIINGNVLLTEDDFFVPAIGMPLTFSRSYNSASGHNGVLGPKWTHCYDWGLTYTNTTYLGSNYVWSVLRTGGGQELWFRQNTNDGSFRSPADNNYALDVLPDGTCEITIPGIAVYHFDTNGILQAVRDLNDNMLTLIYTNDHPAHRLTRVENPAGKALSFLYNTNGLLTRVESSVTNVYVSFSYNDIGELTNAVRPWARDAQETHYSYSIDTNGAGHCLTQRVVATGREVHWEYGTDSEGRRTTRGIRNYVRWNGTNYSDVALSFNTNIHQTTVTYSRNGSNIVYQYDYNPIFQRIVKIRGPNSPEHSGWRGLDIQVDNYGNATSTVVADRSLFEWIKWTAQYDGDHFMTNWALGYKIEPTNRWVAERHPMYHVPIRSVDPEGCEVRMDYTNGAISRIRLMLDESNSYDTAIGYHTNGVVSSVTNANGHAVSYVYDTNGYPAGIIPDEGPAIALEANEIGYIVRIEAPGKDGPRVVSKERDEFGRVKSVTYPDNSSVSYTHDVLGRVVASTDPVGRVVEFEYDDAAEKIAKVTRYLEGGSSTQAVSVAFSYDTLFNTVNITDPADREVEGYLLDDSNRPIRITNVDGQEMSIAYGVGGHVLSVTRFDGTEVRNEYDSGGRLWKTTLPDTTNTFTYYRNNLLKTAENGAGIIENQYNTVNRLIAASGVGPSSTVTYTYYPAGQRATADSVAGAKGYSYDAAERLLFLDSSEGSYAWTYDEHNGLAETMQYPNGLECRYSFDVMNRPTNIVWRDAASNVVRGLTYSYSAAGMITNIVREDESSYDYEYDTLDRLVREQKFDEGAALVLENEYRYDLTGNRTQKVSAVGVVNYEYGPGNRMVGWSLATTGTVQGFVNVYGHANEPIGTDPRWGERTVNELPVEVSDTNFWLFNLALGLGTQEIVAAISDEAGNVGRTTNTVVVKIATNGAYQFDSAGNVTNIAYAGLGTVGLAWDGWYMLKSVATNGATAESYTYDAFGRRARITKGTNTLCLVYDGPHCIAEVDTNGVLVRSYTYGPGIDNVLAMTVHQPDVQTYYYIKDHLGSTLALTDESGAMVESYSYDAWGRVLGVYDAAGVQISESAVGNRILWQGREYTWSTGLYYFRARWYDPITGRWLSKDPIGIAGGLNQYVAFGNNPVNFVDPYGLLWLQIIAPIVGGSLNAIEHYDAFVSGDMSGADYSQSIVFGAGAAFLSSFIPGVSGVLVGGIMAGVNDAYNQSLDPNNSGIDIGQSGQAAVIGTVVGLFTYSGQALFVNVVGMPDQIGQVLGSQGSLFHNYSDWGGVMGFLGGTLLTPGGGSQNANTCGGP